MEQFAEKIIRLIAIYARVSTARQEEERTIENQIQELEEFAKKNGWTIMKRYVDDGWSGDMLARPQLDELRHDAKDKLWDAVLIYDPDRLARRYSYQELVTDELRENGVEVLFITTPTPKNGEEKILHGVRGLFAEYERVKIAERFRIGKMRKVRDGHILTSDAPYGLTYIKKQDKNQHGYYAINESELRVLKMMYQWVDEEDLTVRGVIKRLKELGIKPRKSKRGIWSTSTVSHALHNKTYIGEAYYGKSLAIVPEHPYKIAKYKKMKKTSRRIRAEEEWIKIPVPPVLDRDLFFRVQAKLQANFELAPRNKKNEYLLSGALWCSCGARRTGSGARGGKNLYYTCIGRIKSFPIPPTCTERVINARIADDLVWRKIVQLMSLPELMQKQVERWFEKQRSKTEDTSVDFRAIEKEIAKLRNEEDRYNKAYGAGMFTIDQLKDYTAPVRDKVASLQTQMATAAARQVPEVALPNQQQIEAFAQKATAMLKGLKFMARQAIVRSVIEKGVVSQGQITVTGRIPVETIQANSNVTLCSIHRHRRSPERRQVDAV